MADQEAQQPAADAVANALPAQRLKGLSECARWMQFVWAGALACAVSLNFLATRTAHQGPRTKTVNFSSFVVVFLLALVFALPVAWLIFGSIRFFADFFSQAVEADATGAGAKPPGVKGPATGMEEI